MTRTCRMSDTKSIRIETREECKMQSKADFLRVMEMLIGFAEEDPQLEIRPGLQSTLVADSFYYNEQAQILKLALKLKSPYDKQLQEKLETEFKRRQEAQPTLF